MPIYMGKGFVLAGALQAVQPPVRTLSPVIIACVNSFVLTYCVVAVINMQHHLPLQILMKTDKRTSNGDLLSAVTGNEVGQRGMTGYCCPNRRGESPFKEGLPAAAGRELWGCHFSGWRLSSMAPLHMRTCGTAAPVGLPQSGPYCWEAKHRTTRCPHPYTGWAGFSQNKCLHRMLLRGQVNINLQCNHN